MFIKNNYLNDYRSDIIWTIIQISILDKHFYQFFQTFDQYCSSLEKIFNNPKGIHTLEKSMFLAGYSADIKNASFILDVTLLKHSSSLYIDRIIVEKKTRG